MERLNGDLLLSYRRLELSPNLSHIYFAQPFLSLETRSMLDTTLAQASQPSDCSMRP